MKIARLGAKLSRALALSRQLQNAINAARALSHGARRFSLARARLARKTPSVSNHRRDHHIINTRALISSAIARHRFHKRFPGRGAATAQIFFRNRSRSGRRSEKEVTSRRPGAGPERTRPRGTRGEEDRQRARPFDPRTIRIEIL